MTAVSGSVTVGVDIGTTAVKAVAVDGSGTVLARSRIPHRLISPAPDLLEHDAGRAWRRGPLQALAGGRVFTLVQIARTLLILDHALLAQIFVREHNRASIIAAALVTAENQFPTAEAVKCLTKT